MDAVTAVDGRQGPGLRRGEAVGLPEECVDLTARRVVIR